MLKDILKRMDEDVESQNYDEDDFEYFEDLFTGFRLENRDGELILVVYRDNLPGEDISEYVWPGTEDDYNVFIDWLEDNGTNLFVPDLIIFLMKKEQELIKLKEELRRLKYDS
jgi:hypothetical protein